MKNQFIKDKRQYGQTRGQGYPTAPTSVVEGSRESRKGKKSQNKRHDSTENQPDSNQIFYRNKDNYVQNQQSGSRDHRSRPRDETAKEGSEEESIYNHRSQSNGRNTKVSNGNRSGFLQGSSRKGATTALPSTSEMRKTHGGFYKPSERSKEKMIGYFPDNDDRGHEHSFETDDFRYSNRGLHRESRTAQKENRKLPVIRIMDKTSQSRRNLNRVTDNNGRDYSRGRYDDEDGSGREDFTQRNEDEVEEGLYKSRSSISFIQP